MIGRGLTAWCEGTPWQKEWMEWLEEDIIAQETGAEAAGEAGQPMVVQQAEVGSDFAAQRREAEELRELQLEGWTLWKEGRAERFRDQGHSGHWYEGEMKWLREDNAAWDTVWERKLSGRREKQVQQEDEVAAVATAVKAEGSRGAQRKRGRSGGGRQKKGRKAAQQKKRKVQLQRGV